MPYNPEPNGITFPAESAQHYTEDQRMAAFGAVTYGMKLAKQISPSLLLDVKYEFYRQRSQWHSDGDLSLPEFRARSVQAGISYQF